ncbi:MAG: 50S ribosomal protein L17 [Candidatus Magasanikbacteria bacterium RIFCSPHIGHO2_02_FULL_41_13]|uniref:Large ribosomal subunit protein bL17 n=1 Tax=Candidatus Magasanikbacteria bacterium RIFCSPHIGHO2_02_FULL_41_13 TaxID=1798676 RepID=A0A1F6M518_9BACT|nr:MAG: 50S ribosomal protein L17 [Candidatus Magasanikbacteria bacterium RIFCSPHIGHO2_02_FULL_41_13]
MRHNSKKVTLGREAAPRRALMRNLAESLILEGSIRTTTAKAKALRTVVEPLVTKAKTGTLANMRNIKRVLFTREALDTLMKDIAPRYAERSGGYTRVIKLAPRASDGADMARIEFV